MLRMSPVRILSLLQDNPVRMTPWLMQPLQLQGTRVADSAFLLFSPGFFCYSGVTRFKPSAMFLSREWLLFTSEVQAEQHEGRDNYVRNSWM